MANNALPVVFPAPVNNDNASITLTTGMAGLSYRLASTQNATFTLASLPILENGTRVELIRNTNGAFTLTVAAGTSTLKHYYGNGSVKVASRAVLTKTGLDEWTLSGDVYL